MVDDPEQRRDPVEELAEEFLQRRRSGGQPTVEEYAQKHPQWAERIRQLFPTLLVMEELKAPEQPEQDQAAEPEPVLRRLGDYRIIREIGRGGMGVVYEAEQESLGRRVAVKVLPGTYLSSPKSLKRFRREARAAARLHHTNIVPVFGVGQQDGIHYYVMQYIQGRGLDQVLSELSLGQSSPTGGRSRDATLAHQPAPPNESHTAAEVARTLCLGQFASPAEQAEEGTDPVAVEPSGSRSPVADPPDQPAASPAATPPDATPASSGSRTSSSQSASRPAAGGAPVSLSPGEGGHQYWQSVAGIGVQVAEALHYAHHQGTLHRDIKPGNLLLDTGGTVWIADFGLAKLAEQDDVTRSGDVVGTLRYMAPEQFDGRADNRSDVYSLGLTLYELLTLRPAFDEEDRGRLILQVTRQQPPAPRKLNRTVPRDLETICVKAIARDPAHRYQSAGELAEDLQCFLEDRPIRARRISPLARLWRWCRRNRALAAVWGLAMVLLVALAVVGMTGYVITSAALKRESLQRKSAEDARQQADDQRKQTEAEYGRAEANLRLAMEAFEEVFDNIAAVPVVQSLSQIDDSTEQEEDGQADEVWPELGTASAVTPKDAAVLQSMLKFYDRFAQQNLGNVNLQDQTARACRRVGEIQQRLGNLEAAEKAYRQALAIYRQPEGTAHRPGNVAAAAAVYNKLGTVCRQTGRFTEARQAHLQARDLLLAQTGDLARQPGCRLELVRAYNLLAAGGRRLAPPGVGPGGPISKRGPFPRPGADAVANHLKALEILRTLVEEQPDNPQYQLELARTYRDLSVVARRSRQEEAARAQREAIRIFEELVADYPANPDYRFELAETYARLGRRRGPGSPPKESDSALLERAIEIEAELAEKYPNVPEYQAALARLYLEQSRIRQKAGGSPEAEKSFLEAIRLQQSLAERFPTVARYQGELARSYFMLAYTRHRQGRTAEASDALGRAIGALESLPEDIPGGGMARFMRARAYLSHAEMFKKLGKHREAAEAEQKAKKLGVSPDHRPRGPFPFDRGRFSPHRHPGRERDRPPKPPQTP